MLQGADHGAGHSSVLTLRPAACGHQSRARGRRAAARRGARVGRRRRRAAPPSGQAASPQVALAARRTAVARRRAAADGEASGGSRRTSGSGPARRSPSWPAPRSRWVAADREPGCCQGYPGLVVGFDILVGLPGRMGHFVWDWADLILWAVAYAGQD